MSALAQGDLVAYEWLPRIKSARFCFVVLGQAEPDIMGRERTSVQMVDFQPVWGLMRTTAPEAVLTAQLTPIEEYGVRLSAVDYSSRSFTLERFGKARRGRSYFGADERFEGTTWDTDLHASLRDELIEIVQGRLCELQRARAA